MGVGRRERERNRIFPCCDEGGKPTCLSVERERESQPQVLGSSLSQNVIQERERERGVLYFNDLSIASS